MSESFLNDKETHELNTVFKNRLFQSFNLISNRIWFHFSGEGITPECAHLEIVENFFKGAVRILSLILNQSHFVSLVFSELMI